LQKALKNISKQIYVEIERARLTRKLAAIKESHSDISSAADILQELQVNHWIRFEASKLSIKQTDINRLGGNFWFHGKARKNRISPGTNETLFIEE
jgi:hypothetical protein